MRRLVLLLALPLLAEGAGLAAVVPAGAERIRSFESDLYLDRGDRFSVEERIVWDFEGAVRHGIFREIPIAYGRGRAADYHVALEVSGVEDGAGHARPYRVSTSGGRLRVRIGDPDRTVSGVQEYRIRYRVRRGLLYFDDHDELYWNAVGHEWPVPVDRATAAVFLPDATPEVDTACFTGRQGSVESACTVERTDSAVWFRATRAFDVGEGLSLVVGLPKGVLVEPSRSQRLLDRASDYLSVWLVLPLAVLAAMIALWRRRGRDPGGADPIPVRYEPPAGLSPAEVGTIVDERVDTKDVTGLVLDLAVRGYLRIEEIHARRFLFLSDRDYELVKLRDGADLRPHEKLLLERLFEDGERVRASALRNHFYRHLPGLRDLLYRELSQEGRFFPARPDRVRRRYAVAGGVAAVAGVFGMMMGAPLPGSLALAASGAVVLAFAPVMPRRTRRGRRAYREILGFREFVERVDRDRLDRLGTRTVSTFERALPFAMVLGVADAWADAFADVYREPPGWYVSPRFDGRFATNDFVSDLGRSLHSVGSALTSQPRQSGSGSSGFGGGGFSGGGFGGGGGGSW